MTKILVRPSVVLPMLLGFGSLFLAPPPFAAAAAARNVVLVSIDTLRADHVGCYGGPAGATPTLDRLAARGARFEKAWSAVPITTPSHASFLTGLFPPETGVRTNGIEKIPAEAPTLAERLKALSFQTAGFVGAFPLDRQFGFDRGFETYDDEMPSGGSSRFDAERRATVVVDRALAWLGSRDSKRPFFLFVHLYDPHRTYQPPEPFRSRWPKDPYTGEIAYADAEVGRLFDRLEKEGRAADTLFVVVSDHGEGLGEHGEETHMTLVYDATLRVPMIFAGPGVPKGRVVSSEPASLVDLVPTILAAVGAKPSGKLSGSDLSPLFALHGKGTLTGPRPFWAESLLPEVQFGWAPLTSVREGKWKYIRAPEEELFDTEADPGELKNLLGSDPERDNSLRRLLRRTEKELQPVAPPAASEAKLDPEALRKLQSLGYLAAGGGSGSSAGDPMKLPDPKKKIDLVNATQELRLFEGTARAGEAIEGYRKLLRENPGEGWLRLVLARALVPLGRPAELLEVLGREAVGALPAGQRFDAISLRAVALEESGRYEEALAEWDAAELLSADGKARALAGRLRTLSTLVRTGEGKAALPHLAKIAAAEPKSVSAARWHGLARLDAGEREVGLAELARAARLEKEKSGGPLSPEESGRLAAAEHELERGRLDSAQGFAAPLAASKPDGRSARLSIVLWSLADRLPGPDREAIDQGRKAHDAGEAKRAVELLGTKGGGAALGNPARLEALGRALAALGRSGEAKEAFERALRLEPNLVPADCGLARLAEGGNDPASAEALWRRALAKKGDFDPALRGLGKLLSKEGKHREAIALLRKAISARLDDPAAHRELAAAYRAASRPAEAAEEEAEAKRLEGKGR